MNCSQARKIPIRKILESFSLFPSKKNRKSAFYFAIDREENTPSLLVDFITNSAFDFGTGKKYDCISLVQVLKKCSVSEALKYLEKFHIFKEDQIEIAMKSDEKNYRIVKILDEVSHPALLKYLAERKVLEQKKFLKEIHFEMKNHKGDFKNYFALGFKNSSGAFEVRNKFFKGCLGKKDITFYKNNSSVLKIFEGFFDFLTYKNMPEFSESKPKDYLILNSISLINFVFPYLDNYQKVELFLDNDAAGTEATDFIKSKFPHCEDRRVLYKNYVDLNEWICGKKF